MDHLPVLFGLHVPGVPENMILFPPIETADTTCDMYYSLLDNGESLRDLTLLF